jgi:pimeloyl-ACP methyl ester carboxylesterase
MYDTNGPVGQPLIVCLHASASSRRQWNALIDGLGTEVTVMAPDLVGYGNGAAFVPTEAFGFEREIANLQDQLGSAGRAGGRKLHLVGHSYGAATALAFALRYPERVASLSLFEPVLFNLLADDPGRETVAGEIRRVCNQVRARAGRRFGRPKAARCFIEYWSGKGVWQFLPSERRKRFSRLMPKVAAEFDAILGSTITAAEIAALDVPVQLMYGSGTRAPARAVARILSATLPRVDTIEISGVGHMAPITSPQRINPLILRHLERHLPASYAAAA